ncbi:hypothetical protein MAM1_0371c10119 [Mucor ambiguus]|uniref:BTB domain-containing protein n=1 Tax=Mucor ambiguus TaxID=91626 RepID=A0A0C9MIA8_9FUNG|nr:hypothetical protein MAM1_0371c10119 [Mucor ambiguus]
MTHHRENSQNERAGVNNTLHSFSIIRLNVGGTSFTTLYKKIADSSFFRELIADKNRVIVNQDEIFIDRDGELFRQILLFLRTRVVFSRNKATLTMLLQEATFYQLDSVIHALREVLGQGNEQKSPSEKFALEFIDLRDMFSKERDLREAPTYTLTKNSGNSVETFAIVDFITIYSRADYNDYVCAHPDNNEHCRCYYYPKLVLVSQKKRQGNGESQTMCC